MGGTTLITLCNRGYIKFVKNLNASLQKIESPLNLSVYCLDSETFQILENNNIECKLLENSDNDDIATEMTSFLVEDSYDLYLQQFQAITDALETNENVIWTDADCVFLDKKLFQHLEEEKEGVELLYLSDTKSTTSKYGSTGLMYITSNENTKDIFSVEKVIEYIDEDEPNYFRPQGYLNKVLQKNLLKNKMISNKLCRSQNFINKRIIENLYLVHYNWTTPQAKEKLMVEKGHWYVTSRRKRRNVNTSS